MCLAPACDRQNFGNGWCQMHYQQIYRSFGLQERSGRRLKVECRLETCAAFVDSRGLCSRHAQRRDRYGLTDEQLVDVDLVRHCQSCSVELVDARGSQGKCVDHCHDTGRFRGVLCNKCNTVEGAIKDGTVDKVVAYLKDFVDPN